ncbi:MAG: hypothetical protein HKM24_03140 [Gammaproteobacteria bacterium]|nr:hypothetical protein [Gammaproteobacteria bacterium]
MNFFHTFVGWRFVETSPPCYGVIDPTDPSKLLFGIPVSCRSAAKPGWVVMYHPQGNNRNFILYSGTSIRRAKTVANQKIDKKQRRYPGAIPVKAYVPFPCDNVCQLHRHNNEEWRSTFNTDLVIVKNHNGNNKARRKNGQIKNQSAFVLAGFRGQDVSVDFLEGEPPLISTSVDHGDHTDLLIAKRLEPWQAIAMSNARHDPAHRHREMTLWTGDQLVEIQVHGSAEELANQRPRPRPVIEQPDLPRLKKCELRDP